MAADLAGGYSMKNGFASFRSTGVVVSLGIVPILLLVVGIRWGFTAEEQGALDGFVHIRGNVINEEGDPVANLPVSCKDSQQEIVREVLTNEKGEFTLQRLPSHIGTIDCEVGGDRVYVKAQKKIPVKADTQVAFTLDFQTIKELRGWIAVPKGWGIENALVQITRKGVTLSRRTDANGQVTFENLKAGPATVSYSADGVQAMAAANTLIIEGGDLSASLLFDWFPFGLLLLIPAVVVLALRAGLDWWWKQNPDEHSMDTTSILIFASLVIWGATFLCLWFALRDKTSNNLHYFHPGLSFPLAVPVFGFLGSLLFVIDVFLKEKQDAKTSMEFVLRLVLGPYVAIVMVLLFSNTFNFIQVSNHLEAQATVAFFSGFLVVLVLQSLSEKGNELLGQWRSASRYEPTEIARTFHLAVEEDLKLKKVNLKYLDQLRVLKKEDLVHMAKQSDLGEGFLLGLRNQVLLENLKARIGIGVWKKLGEEEISSVWDLAPLTPARIQELSQKHDIDPAVLTKYSDDAKELLETL
jgi:hypothetical protein